MPQVTGPEGVPINIPSSLNGRELRKNLNIPPNKIVTKKDKDGKEQLVKDSDNIKVQEGDSFDSLTQFQRG